MKIKKVFFSTAIIFCTVIFFSGYFISIAYSGDSNLAVGKVATQSSTQAGGDPQRAVDGNTDGDYASGSVSHTKNEPQEWWQVDLGRVQKISKIRIWNRTDCCRERLSSFYVLVSDSPFRSFNLQETIHHRGVWNTYHEREAGSPTEITINSTGRFVRIHLAGKDSLSLAEVQIFGDSDVNQTQTTGGSNLALRKMTTQSSTDHGGDSQKAVDGNTDGAYTANSITRTNNGSQEWWQVDLGRVQEISKIRIWNRTDCCGWLLSRFYVFVSGKPFISDDLQFIIDHQPEIWKHYQEGAGGGPTEITVNQPGRFIRIQLSGTDYLSLAEVEVIGLPGQ